MRLEAVFMQPNTTPRGEQLFFYFLYFKLFTHLLNMYYKKGIFCNLI